ncbi:isochorismatase family cysteine hydrolase [Actinoallomurus rhizosphaericola]|uniref:isochorismatase family cysteine hydrolase n=1 Tax=Actinoallomurus rhizosphaericola TaxID=2952536 RepID=UPI0020901879|nr:isochorismatase family cysteine hydrolase [Actinoallomurus rhizosphaericola]MCO5994128.1 cysteine hydrolase [Actinoallomurus rhizosphaericola]
MPITTIDPRTALIVVDLQQGIVTTPLAHPVDDVIQRSTALLKEFRSRGLPIVLVNVAGSPAGRTDAGGPHTHTFPAGWTDLIPELERQDDDLVVTKYARSAFTGTGLAERLRELNVTQVVITGIATSSGVESTARDAHEQGFHVTLPLDAMTDSALDRHEHSVAQIFPRIAETGTTADVLSVLALRS